MLFSESFEYKLDLKRKKGHGQDICKDTIFLNDLADIYNQTKITFSEISTQKATNELTYHMLYFAIYLSVVIQDF